MGSGENNSPRGRPKGDGHPKSGGRLRGPPYKKTDIPKAAKVLKKGVGTREMTLERAREIAKVPSFQAWQRAMAVVDDIWTEYAILRNGITDTKVINPGLIAECQERLMK